MISQVLENDLKAKYDEIQRKNNSQQLRLEEVKRRLDVIAKGAQDCDGYTSNSEEATFIVRELFK